MNTETTHEISTQEIIHREDGSVEREEWWLNGKQHREDGPAWVKYNPDGSVHQAEWYLEGQRQQEKETT